VQLYDLVAHSEAEVRKQALHVFCGLAKAMEGAFTIIDRADVNNARRGNRSPYQKIVECLSNYGPQEDMDLKVVTLTLLNWMIVKCPSEKKLCKFLSRLENLGIYDELRVLGKCHHPEMLRQLKNFQKNAKIIVQGSHFEIQIYKQRNKELQEHIDVLESKIEHYVEQQSLYKLMRDDLENYRKVADMSKELATYYSPFTPLQQYRKE